MSTSSSKPPASRSSEHERESPFQPIKPSPSFGADWLAALIFNARAITAAAEALPFPYVKGVFGSVVFLLETVEKVQKNRDQLKELCADTVDVITVLRDQISCHGDTAALKFKGQCEELQCFLQDVVEVVHHHQIKPRGLSARIKEAVKSSNTTDEIIRFRARIREVRSNFMLMATINTNFQVQKVLSVLSPTVPAPQVPQPVNNCPPPTRIFHGRQTILDQMHQYFTQNEGQQDIFLLYGLGGAGKTQIALKFIEETISQFTDIFLVDTSTTETINAGLQSIARTKSVGDSSQDALQWLKSKPDEWLLFFDNADDPKIDLNKYFPQCSHGNILVTSRNPGLCVYAGAHCAVSDMEEIDAMDLLLRSSAQDTTNHNKETAAQIVKVLHYLPLAIIQAGAFISKSRNLEGYLALFADNKSRLLTQRPAQSHDNYAWTVYTTWQISFDQLSELAKTFLKLCSFLHYQGISEDIFKNAPSYKFEPSGPSKEELEVPLKVLAQFLAPTGVWDPLCFIDVTNELAAFSLINFDSEKKLLSIHPLVHEWTRSTLSNEADYHCMAAITGMSISEFPKDNIRLAVSWMLPHIDSLMRGNSDMILDFRHEYAKIYALGGKPKKSVELEAVVLEKRRNLLGEDNPNTLEAMYLLAWAYEELGKLQDAEGLGIIVVRKRLEILGADHRDTLEAMGILALVYQELGKLKEAEELQVIVHEKYRNILGDSHLDTLRAMGNLALSYGKLGRLREAEELDIVVLEKRKKILGNQHPLTLLAMSNLASVYHNLGKSHEAEELLIQALEEKRIIIGDNHPSTLTTMGNLASIYKALGKFQESEQLEVVVLEKWSNSIGDNHPIALTVMGNLAVTRKKLGRLHEAEKLEVALLEKRKHILGENHPDTLLTMGNLAVTYNKLGRLQEAEGLELVVLEKRRRILGDNHPDTLRTMSNLGSTFHKLERWQEAEELLFVALQKQREILSANHPFVVDATQTLLATYKKVGKFKEAEDLNAALKSCQA
ncbi:hypothetical protein FB451DRAFT_1537503 [Mycena latifolia]|nr:hypothetical protein FB451DRAFT_1537503 [Mycena latifolia]